MTGRSNWIPLFSTRIIFTRGLRSKVGIEKAAQLFEKAQRVRPEDYQSPIFLGVALTQLGRRDEALRVDQLGIKSAEKYLELNPDEARAYSLGANVLVRLGEKERSKQWCEQAMALAPNDPIILYNAACHLAQLGEAERALDGLERQSRLALRWENGSRTTRISRVSAIIRASKR